MHSDCSTHLLSRWWIIISTIRLGHSRCWIWLHGKGHRILEIFLLWVGVSYVVKWLGVSIERCLPWSCNVLGLYGLLWSTRLMLHIGTTVDHWYCCLLLSLNLVLLGRACPFQECTNISSLKLCCMVICTLNHFIRLIVIIINLIIVQLSSPQLNYSSLFFPLSRQSNLCIVATRMPCLAQLQATCPFV